jgi:predicted RNA binding protein YcfA (HicA-like mRNA interferase family)
MKVREIIRKLENEGWELRSQKDFHMVFNKIGVKELITVLNHGVNPELSIGVMKNISKIAGWEN